MGRITIIGTLWRAEQLTFEAAEALQSSAKIFLHTERCGCAEWLRSRDIPFETLDRLYLETEDFDAHAAAAAQTILEASRDQDVAYCVFDVRDRSAMAIAAQRGVDVRILAGPPIEGALLARASGETRAIAASDWEDAHFTARENCLIREMDTQELAAELKLKLMDVYPEEIEIQMADAYGAPRSLPLYALDRQSAYDHTTCALIPAARDLLALERYDEEHLNEIMRVLCGPGGCPWDRAQTHESLRSFLIEEAYEAVDAIDAGETEHLYDELGDVLLQIALHAEIGRRHGEFNITDVSTAICKKMIQRHTHVFGSDTAHDSGEVVDIWVRNKMAERGQKTRSEVLRDVTKALPAALRAIKVLRRSADVGLGEADPRVSVARALDKLSGLSDSPSPEASIGEALLWIMDASRQLQLDPEIALNHATDRFIARFRMLEEQMAADHVVFGSISADMLQKYWDFIKL